MDPRLIFLIVTGIITLVVCSIWWYSYGCEDMEDFFFENGWLPLSICLVLGGIIYGFVFWLWWAMLLIMIPILVIIIVLCISDGNDKKDRKEKYKSIFKCKQCGANLIKESEGGNTLYYCQYCDTKYSEKELKEQYHKEQNGKNNDYDLTDFEKEYFEM
ncbi:MAG: hypothetical protein J6T74_04165, partial [Clostridia bacterium]|nr:hypothetical protein [Clostridia bacterium]